MGNDRSFEPPNAPRCTLVVGAPRSGKTTYLVDRCCDAPASERVLAVAAGPQAAAAFRKRLEDRMGATQASRVLVETTAQMRERLAGTYVLCETERRFLVEDLKAAGFSAPELRAAFAALGTGAPSWRDTADGVGRELARLLAFQEAALPEEAALRVQETAGTFDAVLVDDGQWLSRLELEALSRLAAVEIVVAGNPNQGDPGACLMSWTRDCRATVVRMHGGYSPLAVTRLCNALGRQPGMDETCLANGSGGEAGEVAAIKWRNASEEAEGMARYLQLVLRQEEEVQEAQTVVAVPQRSWLRIAVKALAQRRLSVEGCEGSLGLSGDPRRPGRDGAYRAYAQLALLARPDEPTGWRLWCGLGLPDLGAASWHRLMELAERHGWSATEALAEVAAAPGAEPFAGGALLAERWNEGQRLIQAKRELRGFSLVGALGASDVPELAEAAARLADGGTRELFALVRASFEGPLPALDAHSLQVVPLSGLRGTSWERVCLLGVVDGWVPQESGGADGPRHRMAFLNACSRAERDLVISGFATAPLALAQRTGLATTRKRRVDGADVAGVRPSPFLAETGDSCPGTVGGDVVLDRLMHRS